MITTATVSISAASFDIGEGLITGIYPNDQMEKKEQLLIFGVDTQEELDEEADLMSKGKSFVCKHSREDASFNLLDIVDVPAEINKKHVLFDICEIIDGFETVLTEITDAASFSPLAEALENSRSYENDPEGHSEALKHGDWDKESRTLKDGNNLIIIKNIREITPQEAVIFKLAGSF